MRYKILPRY